MESEAKHNGSIIRESLRIAFIELLKKKEYEEITVTELCKKAGVSRTGFYRKYYDKKEIIDDIIETFLTEYREQSQYREYKDIYPEEWYQELFTFISQHFDLLAVLMNKNFTQQLLASINQRLLKHTPQDVVSRGRTLLWIGAVYNLIFQGINAEHPAKVETVLKMCQDFLPPPPFEAP